MGRLVTPAKVTTWTFFFFSSCNLGSDNIDPEIISTLCSKAVTVLIS
jgi:hypothetical protein